MQERCRLCGGDAKFRFSLKVLDRHDVKYFECSDCGCLQTEKPYWLKDAYKIPGVHIDVGQAARILQTWVRLCFLLEIIGFNKESACVDYGGSAGLLTRLMRDRGFRYFSYDTYGDSMYANYFRVEDLSELSFDLLSAFEVVEHFPEPAESLEKILAASPGLIVFSTQFYEGQGADWDYLVPSCGQHVFFYREAALKDFCRRFDYILLRRSDFFVLVKNESLYLASLEGAANAGVDSIYTGELVTQLGWGTEHTNRDHIYAKARFERELRASGSKASFLQKLQRAFWP